MSGGSPGCAAVPGQREGWRPQRPGSRRWVSAIQKKDNYRKKGKGRRCGLGGGGQNLFNSMPQLILHQDNLKNKKLMKRGADIWRNGCFGIMDYFALGRMWRIGWIHKIGWIHPYLQIILVQVWPCATYCS